MHVTSIILFMLLKLLLFKPEVTGNTDRRFISAGLEMRNNSSFCYVDVRVEDME